MKRTRINAYIKPWLKQELEALAEKSGDSESEIVSAAIEYRITATARSKLYGTFEAGSHVGGKK